jgi:hypothetical protein
MTYQTLEVELENGLVRPSGAGTLPAKAHALLTLLDSEISPKALTCGELAERWVRLEKLPSDEAKEFADDIEKSRSNLQPPASGWD